MRPKKKIQPRERYHLIWSWVWMAFGFFCAVMAAIFIKLNVRDVLSPVFGGGGVVCLFFMLTHDKLERTCSASEDCGANHRKILS